MQLPFIMLDYLLLMVLLFVPRYYASKAAKVITLAGHVNVAPCPTPFQRRDDKATVKAPEQAHLNPCARSSSMSQHSMVDRRRSNIFKELQTEWKNFIIRCRVDWVVTSSFSCTFLVASPAALQIAYDPTTRFFVYLAIFCAASAIAYSMVNLSYFRDSEKQTVEFAKAWAKIAKKDEKQLLCAQWVILALPAVALSWGAMSLVLVFISSSWHDGPSNTESSPIGLTLQLAVTMFFVADLGCLLWTTLTLRKFKPQSRDELGARNPASLAL